MPDSATTPDPSTHPPPPRWERLAGYAAGGCSAGALGASVWAYQTVGTAPAAWPVYAVAAATAGFGVVTIARAARTLWRALESRRLDHEIEIARKQRELAATGPRR